MAGIPAVYGVRWNAGALGAGLWGGSLLQVGVATALLACALGETLPGRRGALARVFAYGALGAFVLLGLTLLTFGIIPTYAPQSALYFRVCISRSFLIGLLPLAVALLLLRRGVPLRPLAAGALAGLGAGLLADSGWRIFCEVTDPAHVLAAHGGAVAAVGAVGALSSAWWGTRAS
jgi:hypothetical protein